MTSEPLLLPSEDFSAIWEKVLHFEPSSPSASVQSAETEYNAVLHDLERFLPKELAAREFIALFNLLDDPDTNVSRAVRNKLISCGRTILEPLRLVLTGKGINTAHKEAFHAIQRHFQSEALQTLLAMVRTAKEQSGDIDLEAMYLALSQFGYPETDTKKITETLDSIALRVHLLFMKSSQHNDLSLLMCINRAFFEEMQFRGADDDNYHHPDNTYAYSILQNKQGIPISLCTLYLLVAERADARLLGVGMPAHFLMYHPELDVFIDAFNNGAFLSRQDCKRFIEAAGFAFDPTMLEQASNTAILLRMIRNLIFSYSKTDNKWELEALHELSAAILEVMNEEEE